MEVGSHGSCTLLLLLMLQELDRGESDVLECDADASCLYLNAPRVTVDLTLNIDRHSFRFDDVFDEHVDNDQLYERAIQPLVGTAFRGGKGTVFAYGQTGSGKTFTMLPLPLRTAADISTSWPSPATVASPCTSAATRFMGSRCLTS